MKIVIYGLIFTSIGSTGISVLHESEWDTDSFPSAQTAYQGRELHIIT